MPPPRSGGSGSTISQAGGDYDVLSWVERNLLYLEVKSSPPKHIEGIEIGAFLDRIEALMPNFAILLVDTELRMKDKLVPLFEERARDPERIGAHLDPPTVRRDLSHPRSHLRHQ